MATFETIRAADPSRPSPRNELRVLFGCLGIHRYKIWQVPCPETRRHVGRPLRIGALAERNLEFVEHRVLRNVAEKNIRPGRTVGKARLHQSVPERLAVMLGVMFRALALLRSRDSVRAVAEGIEAMEGAVASYWLGMATHRPHPPLVLAGLRLMLTGPPTGSEHHPPPTGLVTAIMEE